MSGYFLKWLITAAIDCRSSEHEWHHREILRLTHCKCMSTHRLVSRQYALRVREVTVCFSSSTLSWQLLMMKQKRNLEHSVHLGEATVIGCLGVTFKIVMVSSFVLYLFLLRVPEFSFLYLIASIFLWNFSQFVLHILCCVDYFEVYVLHFALFTPPSRYSDWLRAGRLRGRGSSPGRVKNFRFSMSSKPALGSTQPPIQ
jgi:hypothetical protein